MVVFKKRLHCTMAARILAAIVSIVCDYSPALAQDAEAWRCTTDYGTRSANAISVSRQSSVLSGRILVHSGVVGEQWEPGAHIAFTDSRNPAENGCFCNGIRAEIYSNEPDIVKFFIIYNGRSAGIAQASVGIPITFHLAIDGKGIMTVSIGKTHPVSKSVQLMHPQHDRVFMDCSSSDVSFLNLRSG
jgi:hypothetical protein